MLFKKSQNRKIYLVNEKQSNAVNTVCVEV
jgi:hypothetical protein